MLMSNRVIYKTIFSIFLYFLVPSLNGLIRLIAIFICNSDKQYISKYFSVLPYAFCCRIQISFLMISSVHLFNI